MNQQPSTSTSPNMNAPAAASAVGAAAGAALQDVSGKGPPPGPERDLWTGRTHWHAFIGRVLLWVLLNAGLAIGAYLVPKPSWLTQTRLLWVLAAFFLATSLFMLGGVAIRVLQTRYRLTTQRLFVERGILSRTLDQTELVRVDDVRMQQSFVNRIFNIGTVAMMTTDVTDRSLTIAGIKDPVRVAELVRQQMRAMRGKSVFVETL